MVLNSALAFKSSEINTIFFSLIFSRITITGFCLFNNIAAFKTLPPFSKQYGGVSDHPPPQLTLKGNSTICLSFIIL